MQGFEDGHENWSILSKAASATSLAPSAERRPSKYFRASDTTAKVTGPPLCETPNPVPSHLFSSGSDKPRAHFGLERRVVMHVSTAGNNP